MCNTIHLPFLKGIKLIKIRMNIIKRNMLKKTVGFTGRLCIKNWNKSHWQIVYQDLKHELLARLQDLKLWSASFIYWRGLSLEDDICSNSLFSKNDALVDNEGFKEKNIGSSSTLTQKTQAQNKIQTQRKQHQQKSQTCSNDNNNICIPSKSWSILRKHISKL